MAKFRKAQRRIVPIRLFLMGPSKAGKSLSGLAIGQHLAELRAQQGMGNGRLAAIESEMVGPEGNEQSRLEMYQGEPCPCDRCRLRGMVFDFDVLTLGAASQRPEDYMDAMEEAHAQGYGVVLKDSIWHGWKNILARSDQMKKRNARDDPWLKLRPLERAWIDKMLNYPGDLIATCRVKRVMDRNVPKGQSYVDLGMFPDFGGQKGQGTGIEHEFDHVFFVTSATAFTAGSRATALADRNYDRPGLALAGDLWAWSNEGNTTNEEAGESNSSGSAAGVKPDAAKKVPASTAPADGERADGGRAEETTSSSARPPASKCADGKHPSWEPDGDHDVCTACGDRVPAEVEPEPEANAGEPGEKPAEEAASEPEPDPAPPEEGAQEDGPDPDQVHRLRLGDLRAQVRRAAAEMSDDLKAQAEGYIKKAGDDEDKLVKLVGWAERKAKASA